MSIEDRNLKTGTKLVATYKKQEFTCTVKGTKDGLRFVLDDGREFKSPSSAGSAVMDGSACNGWRFWTPASGSAKIGPKGDAKTKAKKAPARKKAHPAFAPMDDQTGATEGNVRYFCSACMDAFDAPDGVQPTGCPDGHPAE